jgi:diguanylate cyclase (GGDEF)-like protein
MEALQPIPQGGGGEYAPIYNRDPLTGLPDRQVLLDRLDRWERQKQDSRAYLILVDLDRFKMVNDTMGHAAGDELLLQAGRRLTDFTGPEHLVTRLGGDEFVVLCERTSFESVRNLAQAIVQAFERPFLLNERPFRCAGSVGVASADAGTTGTIADLLHAAAAAAYVAKRRGGNQFVVFAQPHHEEVMRLVHLEQDLFHAIERGEMEVHYQAQISVMDRRLIGFEALLRWRHPRYGWVPPSEFIPIAESTSQIRAIGAWVLGEALRQIRIWRARHKPDLFVAVNVSVKQLATEDFGNQVRSALMESGLPGEALMIEVTESVLMQQSADSQLQEIQSLGVRISIDDFGTGFSSLSYLQRLAVSELKLDRTFLEDVGHDERKRALFSAIVQLAHTLELAVVAEGIEEAAQMECVRECSCDGAQGYLLSRPLSSESVEQMFGGEWSGGWISEAGEPDPQDQDGRAPAAYGVTTV